jgi:molybdopterin molybdotransferase
MTDTETTQSSVFLSVDEALDRIRHNLQPVTGYEKNGLRDALGAILAEDILSPINVPGHRNSAMDGYAFNSTDLPDTGSVTLKIAGESFAGHPFGGLLNSGEAVRIMTGAVVPEGADTVVMQEEATRSGDAIEIGFHHKPGAHVRQVGEDLRKGGVVLSKGQKLNPAELGLLASLGIAEVKVSRRLRVATFSTGDELRSIGEPLGDGQIYDSNRYSLFGLLSRLGVDIIDMGVIRDQRETVEEAFREAARIADVVITSGGVSVGDADYVKETLDKLGKVDFWKIAMKPGKPLAFGKINNAVFFGLPGNPVSVMATFYQIVQPCLKYMSGQLDETTLRIHVVTADKLKKRPGRIDFQRGILKHEKDGRMVVHTTGNQGSHILSSMSQANCFIILPADWGDVDPGTLVEVEPFAGLI